jgi:superfamily II DNA/RNA helicase
MDSTEVHSKKRKRKHGSGKPDVSASENLASIPILRPNGSASSDPSKLETAARKKAKKVKRNLKKKIIVFFSSCACVKYHAELLNYIDLPVLDLHGKQKQQKRTDTFEFYNAKQGTLICTDVAARGLDVGLFMLSLSYHIY